MRKGRLRDWMGLKNYEEAAPADDREGFEDGVGMAHDGRDLYLETETTHGESVVTILEAREVVAIANYAKAQGLIR